MTTTSALASKLAFPPEMLSVGVICLRVDKPSAPSLPMRNGICGALLTIALSLSGGCTSYNTWEMGQYADFRPVVNLAGNLTVSLARPAYVLVISVATPHPGDGHRQVQYQVVYPSSENDRLQYPAGRNHLRYTQGRPRAVCEADQRPALRGCRVSIGFFGSVPLEGITSEHYNFSRLVLASDEFIDPYPLAHELFQRTIERDQLSAALRTGDVVAVKTELQNALLGQKELPAAWAGYFVAVR